MTRAITYRSILFKFCLLPVACLSFGQDAFAKYKEAVENFLSSHPKVTYLTMGCGTLPEKPYEGRVVPEGPGTIPIKYKGKVSHYPNSEPFTKCEAPCPISVLCRECCGRSKDETRMSVDLYSSSASVVANITDLDFWAGFPDGRLKVIEDHTFGSFIHKEGNPIIKQIVRVLEPGGIFRTEKIPSEWSMDISSVCSSLGFVTCTAKSSDGEPYWEFRKKGEAIYEETKAIEVLDRKTLERPLSPAKKECDRH